MTYQNLLTENQEGILIITINRPDKMNALNISLIGELDQIITEAYNDNNIKGIILTGSGNKAFAAGADIAEFANFNIQEGTDLSAKGHVIFNKIEHCPKPIIAAINGFALGGGCELAMACHIRIASESAKFGQPEVNLGIIPGYGGTQRLVQLIGKGKALELLMTTDMVKAEEALKLGLINHLTTEENLINKCKEIINKIATKGPFAIAKIIECVNTYFEEGKDGFKKEIEEFGRCFGNEEFKEGTNAFLEKRKAIFRKSI